MIGAVVMVLALLVVIPVAVLMGGALFAAVLGTGMNDDAETRHEGNELLDLNR